MPALLRFAGGLHIVAGRVVVEAELDTGVGRPPAAPGHRRALRPRRARSHVLAAGGLRKGSRYVVRVVRDGEALARQTGLLDARGRPVRGLPPHVVSGASCDAEAAWRGAFLAHGSLTEPGRSVRPWRSPARARGGARAGRRRPPARGSRAKAREVRGADRVRGPRRRRDRRAAHPAWARTSR